MILKTLEEEKLCEESLDFLKEVLGDLEKVNEKIKSKLEKKDMYVENDLYYVYSYSPTRVYVTRQGDKHVEILENLPEELIKNLAEGFILRYKNGTFIIDEELTEKSMNFELDFDNYKEWTNE